MASDYVCDAVCNVCGYVRDVKHYWSDKYIYAMDGHRRQCTVCGAISGLEPHNTDDPKKESCENGAHRDVSPMRTVLLQIKSYLSISSLKLVKREFYSLSELATALSGSK